jgi:hypothetical protein
MLKRRLSKLEKDYKKEDQACIIAVVFKKSNIMKISELGFSGTITEGRALLEKHGSNSMKICFRASRPG